MLFLSNYQPQTLSKYLHNKFPRQLTFCSAIIPRKGSLHQLTLKFSDSHHWITITSSETSSQWTIRPMNRIFLLKESTDFKSWHNSNANISEMTQRIDSQRQTNLNAPTKQTRSQNANFSQQIARSCKLRFRWWEIMPKKVITFNTFKRRWETRFTYITPDGIICHIFILF